MINNQEIIASTEEKVRMSETRIQAFNAFSEAFEPMLNAIYYPGSNIDISPSRTASFQGSRIIYVDTDEKAIQTLQKEGCEAYAEDAENFNPGGVNLLLLLNFYDEQPLKYVVKNGYVICNDHWTGTLRKMLEQSDFKLVGIFTDGNQELRTDPETLREEKLRINAQISNHSRGKAENLFVFKKE